MLKDKADILTTKIDQLPALELVECPAQHGKLARRRVEQSGDDRNERRLAAARLTDEQCHLAGEDLHIDAAQGQRLGIAVAELLGDAAADDGLLQPVNGTDGGAGRRGCACVHHDYPRNTTAGSKYSTLTMLNRLDRTIMTPTEAAVPTNTCHGMKKASPMRGESSPNSAASPTPKQ